MNEVKHGKGHCSRYKNTANRSKSDTLDPFQKIREQLYSNEGILSFLLDAVSCESITKPKVSFLDHAWGQIPPQAHVASIRRLFGLYQIGNASWQVMFKEILPESIRIIQNLVNVKSNITIEFGHNSHELIFRLLSIKFDKVMGASSSSCQKIRILTTNEEFYSFTRQVNRLLTMETVEVDVIEAKPSNTFAKRFIASAQKKNYDVIYVSHITYLTQQNLIPDLVECTRELRRSIPASCFIIIDGYHVLGVFQVDLSEVVALPLVFYVSGILKHLGSGANAGLILYRTTTPHGPLRPLSTGWFSDPSVLGLDSSGIEVGSPVNYAEGCVFAGSTPAYFPALLTFTEVMKCWRSCGLTVDMIHLHVMSLHRYFLDHLPEVGPMSQATLFSLQPEPIRSHTLVFEQDNAKRAKVVVESLLSLGQIALDSRKRYVRLGFGFYHSRGDVDHLLQTLQKINDL